MDLYAALVWMVFQGERFATMVVVQHDGVGSLADVAWQKAKQVHSYSEQVQLDHVMVIKIDDSILGPAGWIRARDIPEYIRILQEEARERGSILDVG